MKKDIKSRIYGWIITFILLLSEGAFIYLLIDSKFLPAKLLWIGAAVLLFIAAIVALLVCNTKKKVRTVLGTILAILIIALLVCGGFYIHKTATTIETIAKPEVEYAEYGVYVTLDDPAKSIYEAKEYTFGILQIQDRAATDAALADLCTTLENDITPKEYPGIVELLDALITKDEVDAILINKSFLELLADIEGHENDSELIRELNAMRVEAPVVTPPADTTDDTTSTEGGEPVVSEPKIATTDDTFTMYITGIDSYGSLSRRSRSDVNILATVNTKTKQVLLISTPRDYFVPLSISGGIRDKLTHAGIYGTTVSKDTISMLYNVEIDYYFKLNFDGFKDIIDALGGVTVVSDYDFSVGKYHYNAGENQLDGSAALVFARERKTFAAGDRQRGRHQMAVIQGVINKATTTPALLTNFSSVLSSISSSFETDMPYEKITSIIQQQLTDNASWNIVSYSVDGTGASRRPYSLSTYAYVMIPSQATVNNAKNLIRQVINGEVPQA